MASLGSEIQSLVTVVQARLNGHPDSAEEWQTIAKQLRSAADKARKVAKLAERIMENVQRAMDAIGDFPPYAGE